jgi:chemotaxis protein methyltransferase CheR
MAITKANFDYIQDLVRKRSALILEPGKEYLVESRLDPLARQEGFSSLHEMVERLRSIIPCELHRKVVEAMTTNETSFFREIRLFEMFRKTILPQILDLRASQRTLNLWCAACSGGQEPYSVAMLLREHFSSLGSWNVRLVASDISTEMLSRARAGRYNQIEINRGLPANLLVKYFQKNGAVWEISPEIRQMVEFREINLIHQWLSLPRMDVIFMRNVLIYLDVETKKNILGRVARLLDPDGYLLLGGAETTTNLDDSFESVSRDGATCFRLRKRKVPDTLSQILLSGRSS